MSFYALGVGLATASWMIYAALAPGCIHGLLNPLTYSFMARVVEPNEVPDKSPSFDVFTLFVFTLFRLVRRLP